MAMTGHPDRAGVRAGPSIMDMSTAMMTTNAVLAALFARERLGFGQFIESALFDTAVTMVGFHAMNYLVSGDEPTRFGNNSRDTVPTAALETADGPIYVACANDRTWQRMAVRVLDRPDLAEHPDYAKTRERTRSIGTRCWRSCARFLKHAGRALTGWRGCAKPACRRGRSIRSPRRSPPRGDASARPGARDPASRRRVRAEHSLAVPTAWHAARGSGRGAWFQPARHGNSARRAWLRRGSDQGGYHCRRGRRARNPIHIATAAGRRHREHSDAIHSCAGLRDYFATLALDRWRARTAVSETFRQ